MIAKVADHSGYIIVDSSKSGKKTAEDILDSEVSADEEAAEKKRRSLKKLEERLFQAALAEPVERLKKNPESPVYAEKKSCFS
ncbi:MAG: hypothetical protein ABGX33_01300 [Cycloclasticus sp.]